MKSITPTAIYIDTILKLSEQVTIKGMMHITGGAFTKLKDLLEKADAIIDQPLKPQPIFAELYEMGVTDTEMHKTFNCGIGFVLAVAGEDVDTVIDASGGAVIGKVVEGEGKVKITSAFTGALVEY
jgi:phosphoribosylformylglycinamidine cyclo-ligase